MMAEERLLMIREAKRKRNPSFMRQEIDRRDRLEAKWRQPKGGQSKIRRKFGGKRKQPSSGYMSPKSVRGLSRNGLKIVQVLNIEGARRLNAKEEAALISQIGLKNKITILKELLAKKASIINIRNPEELIKKTEEAMAKRKAELKAKEEKKVKSKAESLKKAEEKKAKEEKAKEEKTPEEAEKEKEEEKRKVLEGKA